MTADDVIKAVHDLPSLPAVVTELLASIDQEDVDTHALAAKITLDQALTAKTLRLANSSFYGMPAKVTTIRQAVSVLGFHAIRTLVTACSVTASFTPATAGNFDFAGFWRHSIASAVCARVLAPHVTLNPDTAFTAGLLHDLGTLVLATRFPDHYRDVDAYRRLHDCAAAPAELAVFGVDHAAVGSALTAHWKFPPPIQAAVADHHRECDGGAVTLSTVIVGANVVAHALDLASQPDDQVPSLSLATWQALALSDAAWIDVFAQSEALFDSTCQMLTP